MRFASSMACLSAVWIGLGLLCAVGKVPPFRPWILGTTSSGMLKVRYDNCRVGSKSGIAFWVSVCVSLVVGVGCCSSSCCGCRFSACWAPAIRVYSHCTPRDWHRVHAGRSRPHLSFEDAHARQDLRRAGACQPCRQRVLCRLREETVGQTPKVSRCPPSRPRERSQAETWCVPLVKHLPHLWQLGLERPMVKGAFQCREGETLGSMEVGSPGVKEPGENVSRNGAPGAPSACQPSGILGAYILKVDFSPRVAVEEGIITDFLVPK